MGNLNSIAKRELTSLDDQNTKQTPVQENAEKLRMELSVCNGMEGIVTRTSGAVLRRTVKIPKKSVSETAVLTYGLCVEG
jgi:hypothetical protein